MPPTHQYRERDYVFANTLLSLRTTIGLTQQSVATRLRVSRRAVENWEQGLTRPKAEHLKAFLELCVRHAAFAAGHEEEQIRAFWKASRQRVLLDESWLSDLLAQSAPTPSGGAGQDSAAATQGPALWTVPSLRNPHFTGREELLSQLEHELTPRDTEPLDGLHHAALTQAQAIKGLGGIGKTQTAIEYAYRAREQGRYTHTLWIAAGSLEALLASLAALTVQVPALRQPDESDERALANRALRWLEHCQEPWLLIYDNADETSFLPAYVPTAGRGSILFTTRANAVGALAPSLEVDALSLSEGIQLLLRRAGCEGEVTPQEMEEARAIVLALSQFPLAIDQAGAYIEETGCSLSDYLQLYEQHQYQLLAWRGQQATGYPDSVASTWALAFEKIERTNAAAAELLQLCAFVAPDDIPEELLIEGAAFWPPATREAARDRLRFNQVLSTLLAFSLIKRFGRERTLSLHRLVQVVQRSRMTLSEQRQWATLLVLAVEAAFPPDPSDFASWPACQRSLSQALACSRLIEQYGLLLPEAAEVLHRAAIYLYERGLYGLVESLLRRALSLREQLLGEAHLDVAPTLHALALLTQEQGQYEEAESLHQRALRLREQALGDAHPEVASSLNNLAELYVRQGKYEEAEPLLKRALHLREQSLGPEDPLAAAPLNNLAVIYVEQGRYAKAEPLLKRALRLREQALGDTHPDVAAELNNLAELYARRGKYEEAESLFQRALHIFEQALGDTHPDVAYPVRNLALLYTKQGKYEEAESLLKRALRIWEQALGDAHPLVASPLHGLADLKRSQGRYTEAESLYQGALRIREQALGAEHPQVVAVLLGLALLFARQGRESEAQALFGRVLSLREQRRGERHLETAEVLHEFAGFQQARGRTRQAVVLYQRALTTREQILGPDHFLTNDTRERLQGVRAVLGQAPEAAPVEAALQQEERVPAQGPVSET